MPDVTTPLTLTSFSRTYRRPSFAEVYPELRGLAYKVMVYDTCCGGYFVVIDLADGRPRVCPECVVPGTEAERRALETVGKMEGSR